MQTFFHHVPLDRWCKSLAFHFTTKQFQCSCQDHLTQRCTQICANRCAGVVHSDLQSSEYKLPRTACMIPRFTLQRKETSNGKRPFSVYFSVCLQDPLFVVYKTHCLFTQPIVCLQNPLFVYETHCLLFTKSIVCLHNPLFVYKTHCIYETRDATGKVGSELE